MLTEIIYTVNIQPSGASTVLSALLSSAFFNLLGRYRILSLSIRILSVQGGQCMTHSSRCWASLLSFKPSYVTSSCLWILCSPGTLGMAECSRKGWTCLDTMVVPTAVKAVAGLWGPYKNKTHLNYKVNQTWWYSHNTVRSQYIGPSQTQLTPTTHHTVSALWTSNIYPCYFIFLTCPGYRNWIHWALPLKLNQFFHQLCFTWFWTCPKSKLGVGSGVQSSQFTSTNKVSSLLPATPYPCLPRTWCLPCLVPLLDSASHLG